VAAINQLYLDEIIRCKAAIEGNTDIHWPGCGAQLNSKLAKYRVILERIKAVIRHVIGFFVYNMAVIIGGVLPAVLIWLTLSLCLSDGCICSDVN